MNSKIATVGEAAEWMREHGGEDVADGYLEEATAQTADPLFRMWWLSFCDADDGHFLGACIVYGRNVEEACAEAHRQGCNPGGEVLGVPLPAEGARATNPDHLNKLRSREEWEALGHV